MTARDEILFCLHNFCVQNNQGLLQRAVVYVTVALGYLYKCMSLLHARL